jgi:hypothetical protein
VRENLRAACDVEETGNVAWSRGLPARQSSSLPMSEYGNGAKGEPLRRRQTKEAANE